MDVFQVFIAIALVACVSSYSFVSQSQDIVALVGEDVTIQCEVQNLGVHQNVFWLNGTEMMSSGRLIYKRTDRVSIDGAGEVYDLAIHGVEVGDEGEYNCQVPGEDGPIMQSNRLTVNVPPTIYMTPDQSEMEVTEAETFTVECIAEGKPTPTVKWSRVSGEEIESEEGLLMFVSILKEEAGEYECTASNGAGQPEVRRIYIHVRYKPEVRTEHQVISRGPGEDVSIECVFDASPLVHVVWLHNNSNIFFEERPNLATGHDENVATTTADRWTLRISDMQPSDLGTYTCDGANDRGNSHTNIRLTALPQMPVITSNEMGLWGDRYVLTWTVVSGTKVTGYDLMFKEWNSTIPSYRIAWVNSTLASGGVCEEESRGTVYHESYTIRDLQLNGSYVVRLRAHNTYGPGMSFTPNFFFFTSDNIYTSAATTSVNFCYTVSVLLAVVGVLLA